MAYIRRINSTKYWQGCKDISTLTYCWWEYKVVQSFRKEFGSIFLNKHTLPYDPASSLLGTYPREMKVCVRTKTCTWIFIADLFVVLKNCKQHRRPPSKQSLNIQQNNGRNYQCRQQPEWISRVMVSEEKPKPTGFMLHGSFYIAFLKWQN